MRPKTMEEGILDRRNMEYKREVERFPRAYIFGHYDSRGGGMLVIADNVVDAINLYNNEMFAYEADPDMILLDELMFVVNLSVWDQKLPRVNTDVYVGYTQQKPQKYSFMSDEDHQRELDWYNALPDSIKNFDGYYLLLDNKEEINEIIECNAILTTALGIIEFNPETTNDGEDQEWCESIGGKIDNNTGYCIPKINEIPYGFQLNDLSEDACGLYLIWDPKILERLKNEEV